MEHYKIISNPDYNCFECNIIIPIIDILNENIAPYFYSHFYLKFVGEDNIDLFHLSIGCDYQRNVLREFYGIIIEESLCFNIKPQEFIKELRKMAKQGYVGVMLDSFDCPWNKHYFHKIHREHYFLIDAKVQDGYIKCYDGFFSSKVEKISVEYLCRILHSVFVLKRRIISKRMEPVIWAEIGISYAFNCKNDFGLFISALENINLERELEKSCNDIVKSDLVYNLAKIEHARKCYVAAMYISVEYELFAIPEQILKKLQEDVFLWEQAKGRAIQGLLTKRKESINICINILKKLLFLEEEVIKTLLSVWRNKRIC